MNLDRPTRSRLAARLERVNQLANYVTRTRRRDVNEFRVTRDPKAPILEMSADERYFYDAISEVVKHYALERVANELFLLSTPQRLLTSSLAAASTYWSGLADADSNDEIEETDLDLDQRRLHERPLVASIARHAKTLDMTARLTRFDTKYRLLIRELQTLWEIDADAKVIIFSSFKPTLHYLETRLHEDGVHTTLLHGSVHRPRSDVIADFRGSDDVRVLLSSEVGSEGIDLQFSSTIVNYDLPWNPMRLEQRIGRIDRLGQKKKKVTILNLIYDGTIDKRIYERLYERLEIGRRALGDLEAVLGEPLREMTIRLLDPTLTDQQKDKAINQTYQALANRRLEEERLEGEAAALVRHGDYILERIIETRESHRWLNDSDILEYVRDRVLRDFPGSVIETSPPGSDTYRIELSLEGAAAFHTYLTRRGLTGRTRLLSGRAQQRFRFASSVVQKRGRVEYISQLHPLVRFATERDLDDLTDRHAQAVAARVSLNAAPADCKPGFYALEGRRWSTGHRVAGIMDNVQIAYAGAFVPSGELLDADLAERVVAVAATRGRPVLNAAANDQFTDASEILQRIVAPELDRQFGDFVARMTAEVEDRLAIRQRSVVRHFENKLAALQRQQEQLNEKAVTAAVLNDSRRATNLRNLVSAHESKIKRLRHAWRFRENEIEAQRKITPQESDVGCLFLEVHR